MTTVPLGASLLQFGGLVTCMITAGLHNSQHFSRTAAPGHSWLVLVNDICSGGGRRCTELEGIDPVLCSIEDNAEHAQAASTLSLGKQRHDQNIP